MANMFDVTPAGGGLGQGLTGLGQVIAQRQEYDKEQQAIQKAKDEQVNGQTALAAAARSGDLNQIAQVAINHPNVANQVKAALELHTDVHNKEFEDAAMNFLTADDPNAAIQHAMDYRQKRAIRGQSTEAVDEMIQHFKDDPAGAKKSLQVGLILANPKAAEALDKFQQGKVTSVDPTHDVYVDGKLVSRGTPKDIPDSEAVRTLKFRAEQAGLKPGTPEFQEFMKTGGASGAQATLSGDALDLAAEYALANGGKLPAGFSRSQGNQSAAYTRAAELAKQRGMTGQAAILNGKSIQADQTSLSNLTKQYDMIKAFEGTAEKNLDMLVDQSKKVKRTAYPLVNKLLLAGKFQTGDPEAAKLMAIVKPFVDEYAKILSGSTGSAGASDSARAEAASIIAPFMAEDQIDALAPFIRQELHNRTGKLEDQRDEIKFRMAGTGGPDKKEAAPVRRKFNPAIGKIEIVQ